MTGDLTRLGGEGRGVVPRHSRAVREIAQRAELDLAELLARGRYQEVRAILRKRMTEDGMQDVTDVGHLAQALAGGDQFIATLLVPMVQEFARTTARDIQNFGRGIDF
jgi:hypothetical protein